MNVGRSGRRVNIALAMRKYGGPGKKTLDLPDRGWLLVVRVAAPDILDSGADGVTTSDASEATEETETQSYPPAVEGPAPPTAARDTTTELGQIATQLVPHILNL